MGRKLIFVIAAIVFFGASAARPATLGWQKVELEEKLHERVARALRVVVPESEFVATVTILLKGGAAAVPSSGAARFDKTSDIPLGKLDLNAPFDPTTNSDLGEVSLFDSIQQAKALIYLDRKLPADRDALVKDIASGVMDGLGQVPVSVSVDRADLAPPPAPVPAPKPWDLMTLATLFKIPISLLAATLILCLFLSGVGVFAVGAHHRLESRRIAVLEAQDARDVSKREEEQALARQSAASISLGLASQPKEAASASRALPQEQLAEQGFERRPIGGVGAVVHRPHARIVRDHAPEDEPGVEEGGIDEGGRERGLVEAPQALARTGADFPHMLLDGADE